VSIVAHPAFEWMILALIFASSITLCFEDIYLDEKPTLKEALFVLNNIFTVIFTIEMILKWLAFGLWGYFTNAWTILDAFIVAVSQVLEFCLCIIITQKWSYDFLDSSFR